jgi:hypothetical protein
MRSRPPDRWVPGQVALPSRSTDPAEGSIASQRLSQTGRDRPTPSSLSEVSGLRGRDLRFRSHLRPVPGTVSHETNPPGISYACGFAAGGGDQPATLGMAREASVRRSIRWPCGRHCLDRVRARSAQDSSPSHSDLVHSGLAARGILGPSGKAIRTDLTGGKLGRSRWSQG